MRKILDGLALTILLLLLVLTASAFSYNKGWEDAKDFFIDEVEEDEQIDLIPNCFDSGCMVELNDDYGWRNECKFTCIVDKFPY